MNPFTAGGFAPQRIEFDVADLATTGDWPRALDGTLYRIGPNPQFDPIEPYNPLLGDGMVHAFRVRGGRVSYRNRWVRTRQWRLEHDAGRALFATGDPRRSDASVAGQPTDGVANTALVWHAGRLLALEEGHGPIEIDPRTLATRGGHGFDGRLRRTMTAHPKLDPGSGEMLFFGNRFDGSIDWYVADAAGRVTRRHELKAPYASLLHDFAVTGDFVVFPICPVTLSRSRALAGGPALAWEPERGAGLLVVRRDGRGGARWFGADPGFVWHVLGGNNDGDAIRVDLCVQEAPAFPRGDGTMPLPVQQRQRLARWEVDWSGPDRIIARTLCDELCEYPRGDERFATRPPRFGYFACHGGPGTGDWFHRGIGCFDFRTATMTTCRLGATLAVSEPVFVPAAATAAEGDGFLLCVVYDETQDTSQLVVLDAGRVSSGPIAAAQLQHRVPMGFHGTWIGAPE